MRRRHFLTSSLAAAAYAVAPAQTRPSAAASDAHEFYQLRRYALRSGPGVTLTDTYMADALIPTLNRMGIAPVGAFRLDVGPETPTLYLLLPARDVETLVLLDQRLAKDEAFARIAAPFWSAPAAEPAFVREESFLLRSFDGFPKLVLPKAGKGKRIFQLRTYESPTDGAHLRKIEMFHSGEFSIFARCGMEQVFYGDTLIGSRMPSFTYMLCFPDAGELNARWDAFRADPEWKKLSSMPRFASEAIVSNISNLVLNPAPYSQI